MYYSRDICDGPSIGVSYESSLGAIKRMNPTYSNRHKQSLYEYAQSHPGTYRGGRGSTSTQTQEPAGVARNPVKQVPQSQQGEELTILRSVIVDDFFRDMHLRIVLDKRVYKVATSNKPSTNATTGDNNTVQDIPEFIYIIEVTKSGYAPRENQRPTQDMLEKIGPAVAVLWANYRERASGEVVEWRETLRYEGGDMSIIELLQSAYNDIKNKRQIIDNVFDTFSVI